MTLRQLEDIVRPQFIWSKENGKRWCTVERGGGGNTTNPRMGVLVFIGVALMNGFKESDIVQHCEIERKSLVNYKKDFTRAYKECFMASVSSLYEEGYYPSRRLMAKTRLVINSIELHYNKKTIISLSNFS